MKKPFFAFLITLLGFALWVDASAQQAPGPPANGRGMPPGASGLADVTTDPDGTMHFGPRTIPPNMWASPESRAQYVDAIKERQAEATEPASHAQFLARQDGLARKAMLLYPDVQRTEMTIAGVPVIDWKPTHIASRNAHRIALEFEIDAEGLQLAGIGKLEVISVHYGNGSPNAASVQDIVKVYREILKTHKGSQIAMYGISGGCQMAAITTLYLHYLHLPMPGALGLLTCAGGDGDSRVLMNGVDPALSLWLAARPSGQQAQAAGAAPAAPPPTPGIPNRILDDDAVIPAGFPPSFLISGTRDMALSGTARLQRKLRHAGVVVDLNVFDGMWHAFEEYAQLPESKDALTDMWHFFDEHVAT